MVARLEPQLLRVEMWIGKAQGIMRKIIVGRCLKTPRATLVALTCHRRQDEHWVVAMSVSKRIVTIDPVSIVAVALTVEGGQWAT
ncbi:hypothetical protein PAXRUDRAFT_828516 [Paxillus rubicundulus Ve08.2h10]|uniref:Uncharacterized protein n=1 Tax=Paxillus rubicundulus Ve08.2h10 TaxID=930991 RepID=A0A0D0D9X4_9AGAM|nr:hypothetical protein PAXRUDRAFT_828516 [Paxillus rubicundulus Ve08.2h10]